MDISLKNILFALRTKFSTRSAYSAEAAAKAGKARSLWRQGATNSPAYGGVRHWKFAPAGTLPSPRRVTPIRLRRIVCLLKEHFSS